MPTFPSSAVPGAPAPPPTPETAPTVRWLGTINLNDRVNTLYDHHDLGSVQAVQVEQLVNRNGRAVVVKVDRKMRTFTINMKYLEDSTHHFEDFQLAVEAQQGVVFQFGDGHTFTTCYTQDCTGQRSMLLSRQTTPPIWLYRVSIKVVSLYADRT